MRVVGEHGAHIKRRINDEAVAYCDGPHRNHNRELPGDTARCGAIVTFLALQCTVRFFYDHTLDSI